MQTQAFGALVRPEVGACRLLIGLMPGALLYGMYRAAQDHARAATVPMLFIPLVLVIAPVLLISSLGHMAGRWVAQWKGAVAVIAALGFYDAWRAVPGAGATSARLEPSHLLCLFLVAGFFIAHSLVMTGSTERRRKGGARKVAPARKVLEIGGRRIGSVPVDGCGAQNVCPN